MLAPRRPLDLTQGGAQRLPVPERGQRRRRCGSDGEVLLIPHFGCGRVWLRVDADAVELCLKIFDPDEQRVQALGAALDYVTGIGLPNIARYERELEYATSEIRSVPGLRLIGTAAEKTSVLSFVLDAISYLFYRNNRICCRHARLQLYRGPGTGHRGRRRRRQRHAGCAAPAQLRSDATLPAADRPDRPGWPARAGPGIRHHASRSPAERAGRPDERTGPATRIT